MTANNDKNRTYSVFYIPKVTGMHKVSPTYFNVEDCDRSKILGVTVYLLMQCI